MARRGRRVTFHGAFASKADAKRKERAVGGFMQPRTIRGRRRYVVMSENPGRWARAVQSVVEPPAPGRMRANRARPVEIYNGVVAIVARKGKTKNPKLSGKLFEHQFRTRPKMYGMPDGSLLITHRRL